MRKNSIIIPVVLCMAVLGLAAGYLLLNHWLGAPQAPGEENRFARETPSYSDENNNPTTDENVDTKAKTPQENYTRFTPGGNELSVEFDHAAGDMPNRYASEQSAQYMHQYVLSLFEGYVAVYYAFAPTGTGVKTITATPVNALSLDERQRLTDGIKIYNDEQLARILQDYGS